MKNIPSSHIVITGKCEKQSVEPEIISYNKRAEDADRSGMRWPVSLSDDHSGQKLQLEGHLQNYQGGGL